MAEDFGVHRLTNRDRNKPRADKALEERRTGAVTAAMAFTTGGQAFKVLQREVGVLRAKLAEIENAPPTASPCNAYHGPSSSDSSAVATPTRIAELEDENRRLTLKLGEQELKVQQASSASSRARNGDATAACRPCEELSDAVERLKGRVDVLTEDNVKLSSDLKLARAKLNDGVVEDPKMRTLQSQIEDSKQKLAAATSARQAEVQQHKARINELEDALLRKDKEREDTLRTWQANAEAALGSLAKQDLARRRKEARYDALLVSLRLCEDEVTQLLDDPDTPPIRQHCPDLSLLDLLWLLTDQHDEHAGAVRALEDKVERAEAERARTQKQAAAQVKEERERLKGTIKELQAPGAATRRSSTSHPPLSTTAASSTPSTAVMDRLTRTIATLTDDVSQLRDENMTLLLKLAGAEE
ncbi:hypothetical protein JCM9279_003239 [Rhodotorula babjevae]